MPAFTTVRLFALIATISFSAAAGAGIPVQRWTQASGAEIFMVESPGIPMVDVQIDFDAGGRRDPAGKMGLAATTGGMLSKGIKASDGSPALDENQLGEAWADLGANFGVGAGNDRMSFSLRSLTYPDLLPKAVQLASRQLAAPAFPADVWQRERERIGAAIREANTLPATIAQRAFQAAVFGAHPYGFEATVASLARIAIADMADLHGRLIHACRAKVTVVGAVTRAQADAMVVTLLSHLPGHDPARCEPLPPVVDVLPLVAPSTLEIPFESAQAHVLIGQPGYSRRDPDFFAMTVGNYILGGGDLVSRLVQEVREKRGLAYSASTHFSPGLHAGAFVLGLQTRPDQAAQAVQISRDVLAGFLAEGPTPSELKAAKDYLIGGFPLLIDSNRKLLGNVANIAWNGLPLDYLDTWTAQVEKVTAADIKAAFGRKLQPQRMVTVIVGAKAPSAR